MDGVTMPWILKLIASLLKPIMAAVTVKFREEITEWLHKKYSEAQLTENPWDDYLFEFLARMLGVSLPA